MRKIMVTGAAGFIGFHLTERLLANGDSVVGLDNLNDYYDVKLKESRLERIQPHKNFEFCQINIEDRNKMKSLFEEKKVDYVVHLAAQAGVRYSIENPHAYIDANIIGFTNILEGCRHTKVKHLCYASSSSVYGTNTNFPFSVHHRVDHPISLYAATKKANELMAHTYSHLYEIPTTGLRFFTVYGPWGRPDMALFKFTKAILNDDPIEVYNNGEMQRDFTYIDDIVEGVVRVMDSIPSANKNWDAEAGDSASSTAPYRLYNIGNNSPVGLMDFIEAIEEATGKKAEKKFMPLQPGDVPKTYADVQDLMNDVGFKPETDVKSGVRKFVEWYRDYYQV